jgi:hypothetical protein
MDALLALEPVAMIAIEHPGKAEDGKYYSALGYELDAWTAPIDDLFDAVRVRGGFTVGIGDLGNEIGMGYAKPEINALIPYGDRITTAGSCNAPIIASISEFGAYGLIAALAAISGRPVLHSPELEEIVLRAAIMAGAVCGCTGVPQPSIDLVDISYLRAFVHMLHCIVVYAQSYSVTRPFFIDLCRGAEIAAPGSCKGGHGR